MMAEPWPTEIRLKKDRHMLAVSFASGETFELPAEYLRVFSPSAEVQGHSPSERKLVSGKADVMVIEVEPIGNYAVRLHFDDLHNSGIFTWSYLYRLGQDFGSLWAGYLEELSENGLSRR
ncbi:DUF971 domain-containing protein [Afifella marina]